MSKTEQRVLALIVVALLGFIAFKLTTIQTEIDHVHSAVISAELEIERLRLKD